MKKNFAKSAVAMALALTVIVGTASAARKPNLPPLDNKNNTVDYADALLGGLMDIVMDSFDNETSLPGEYWIP